MASHLARRVFGLALRGDTCIPVVVRQEGAEQCHFGGKGRELPHFAAEPLCFPLQETANLRSGTQERAS
jgi:hypothetical protein